ncbi:class I SAM-dependent methyltransferase [candidate division WOR-3 bacterium]|nr:class I SAM-dependent methyltransferase [candidate division WOR-3 bacterium]
MKNVFDLYPEEYDNWFSKHTFAYLTELLALKKAVGISKRGIEIGIGTGRFAQMLEIPYGIDTAFQMLKIAKVRGCNVALADARKLPFKNDEFGYALLMVTLSFVRNPKGVIREAKRILAEDGKLIIGIIDKNSKLGRLYRKKESVFYESARFFSADRVIRFLRENKFHSIKTLQTLFDDPAKMQGIEKVKKEYGKGSFVVIAGIK